MVVLGDAFQGIVAGLLGYLVWTLIGVLGRTYIGSELGQLRNWDGLLTVSFCLIIAVFIRCLD